MPLEKALESQVLVAYMMNGEPLPTKHGFPARLIVPGLYGEKCSKWLTRLEAVDNDYLGYWQQRGWGDEGKVQMTSQVRVPENGDRLARMDVMVGGLAFAGDQGISNVEISADEGTTWMAATLMDPLSPYTWVLWNTEWVPPETGNLKLLVRATDGQGRQQVTEANGTFPNGATGLHSIRVTVTDEQGA
jgi:DMSO/TMAO reductase YedYZ molybdopterin-dependent catalytic subunit